MEIKFRTTKTPWTLSYGGFSDEETPLYCRANYWARVFKSLRAHDEPFDDFYSRLTSEWGITPVFNDDGQIAGVIVDDAMMTGILLKYPV